MTSPFLNILKLIFKNLTNPGFDILVLQDNSPTFCLFRQRLAVTVLLSMTVEAVQHQQDGGFVRDGCTLCGDQSTSSLGGVVLPFRLLPPKCPDTFLVLVMAT